MAAPNVHVELVRDLGGSRLVVGRSSDSALVKVALEQFLCEAEERAARHSGDDPLGALSERAEVDRLRQILELAFPSLVDGAPTEALA